MHTTRSFKVEALVFYTSFVPGIDAIDWPRSRGEGINYVPLYAIEGLSPYSKKNFDSTDILYIHEHIQLNINSTSIVNRYVLISHTPASATILHVWHLEQNECCQWSIIFRIKLNLLLCWNLAYLGEEIHFGVVADYINQDYIRWFSLKYYSSA